MILFRNLKKQAYLLMIFTIILLIASRPWLMQPLIVPLPGLGYIDFTEVLVPLLLLIPISFSLHDDYEIELALTCNVSTVRLMFARFFVSLTYILLPMYLMDLTYRYQPYELLSGAKIVFPIVIPEHYKLYMVLSATVTILFFSSLILFIRVLTRNYYVPVGVGIFVYLLFSNLNQNIHYGRADVRMSLFDPFISNYFLGNEVPNRFHVNGMHNLWTHNRMMFFGIAVILLFLSYLILRREHLHESFGD